MLGQPVLSSKLQIANLIQFKRFSTQIIFFHVWVGKNAYSGITPFINNLAFFPTHIMERASLSFILYSRPEIIRVALHDGADDEREWERELRDLLRSTESGN